MVFSINCSIASVASGLQNNAEKHHHSESETGFLRLEINDIALTLTQINIFVDGATDHSAIY